MNTGHNNQSSSVSSYLLDPVCRLIIKYSITFFIFSFVMKSSTEKDTEAADSNPKNDLDDEIFESISCYESVPAFAEPLPSNKPKPSKFNKKTNSNAQTRIIPCKYAVRGTCHLGDKCLYSHDGKTF